MSGSIFTRTCAQPPLCQREVLRYAGYRGEDEEVLVLMNQCADLALPKLTYKVCWRFLDPEEISSFTGRSALLAKNLAGCGQVVLLAATVGVELDRLIARFSRLSPAKGLMLQAIGAERIEALCDQFCRDLSRECGLSPRPRFSPGYGDLPLEAQRDIFALLDCQRKIGLYLNESLLMSPSKSVTAFMGLTAWAAEPTVNKCAACGKQDCAFRG